MNPVLLWGIAGLALCGAEMLLPGVFLLWIGLAAIGVSAATALFPLGWPGQIAAFVALALALIAFAAARIRARPNRDPVNAPAAGLIGATCTAVDFRAGEGRVQLRDGTWQARIAGGGNPVPGDIMRVVALEGTILVVRNVSDR